MRPVPNVAYNSNLDCLSYNTRLYISNPISHTIYLDILYINAVDIKNFASSAVSFTTKEITRNPKTKSTICRIILYDDEYKASFFDMTDATGEFVDDLKSEKDLLNEKSMETPPQGENKEDNAVIPSENNVGGDNSGFGVLKSKTVVEDINVNKDSFDNLIKNRDEYDFNTMRGSIH
jgi:hypothetical protein